MSATTTDPGVTVATGDPQQLLSAAIAHDQLGSMLTNHASQITTASASLASQWEGQSAAAYHQISAEVAAHFHGAAGAASDAAATLRTFAHALDQAKQAGQRALTQAVHWAGEVDRWKAKLATAQQAVSTAQSKLNDATSALTTLTHVRDENGSSPAAAIKSASGVVSGDSAALSAAQAEVSHAQKMLKNAQDELKTWQGKGDQALMEAELAAGVATGNFSELTITPPPWLGKGAADLVSVLKKAGTQLGGIESALGLGTAPLTVKAAKDLLDALQQDRAAKQLLPYLLNALKPLVEEGHVSVEDLKVWIALASVVKLSTAAKYSEALKLLGSGGFELPKGAAGALGVLNILADVDTFLDPDGTGVERLINRLASVGNAAGTAATLAPIVTDLLGVNAVADWVPGVGEVVMFATGAYLTVDWIAHHGGEVVKAAEDVGKGAVDAGKAVYGLFKSFLSDTPHPVCASPTEEQAAGAAGTVPQLPAQNSPTPGHPNGTCTA